MPLENAILHKISRQDFSGPVTCHKRSDLNAVDGVIHSLFEQSKQQLNRSPAKGFGFFDNSSEHQYITGLINNWQGGGIGFASFSGKCCDYLCQQLELSETPFSACLLFAQEQLLGQHYFYCFWLPMVEAILPGAELEPSRTEAIDAGKLSYGLRLHLDEWQSGDSPKYLTLLASRGNKDLAEAFTRFGNFCQGIDPGQQTGEFLQITEDYADKLPAAEAQTVKTVVLDYCITQDRVGSPVLIQEISRQIDQLNPDKFAGYVTSRQEIPQKEIHTDRQSLKRYMRYFGRDHSLSISFSADRFGKDITYDPVASSLSINRLPKSLKLQLGSYAEKEG